MLSKRALYHKNKKMSSASQTLIGLAQGILTMKPMRLIHLMSLGSFLLVTRKTYETQDTLRTGTVSRKTQ